MADKGLVGKRRTGRYLRWLAGGLACALVLWSVLAYVLLPDIWLHYEHQPALAGRAMTTRTSANIPGDPINIGLAGSQKDVLCAMAAAGWSPADALTLASSIAIVGSIILDRPYRDAPVSPLFYDGRREDLAFEKEAGGSALRRHHVRFWQVLDSGAENRPVWLGAATFDRSVGLSDYTLQVTHRIAPDIDAERDGLAADLEKAGRVAATYEITGVGPTLNGRNGGGDRYFTDGEIRMLRLQEGCGPPAPGGPLRIANPAHIVAKNAFWRVLHGLWR